MIMTHSIHRPSILSGHADSGLPFGPGLLRAWVQRSILRRELRRLLESGAYLVRDIGLDEAAARREAGLPFWQVGPLDRTGLQGSV